MSRPHRQLSRFAAVAAGVALVGGGLVTTNIALATHGDVTLSGSNFEIDTDANMRVDHLSASPTSLDWATVSEDSRDDSPSGGGDEAFGNGTKENTAVPSIVTGGIPPNKSDLKIFGVFQEGDTSAGFLNMYWSRVQDPTGTTNMDFELNKRYCDVTEAADSDCTSNGVTPKRSIGDLLITYDLSNGGTVPFISYREWNGSAWSGVKNLSANNDATGSINASDISAADSGGLGAHSPRTFGEAQIRLSALLGSVAPTSPADCRSFGSVYLKSRSSDSFTAALKDFVPPVAANITNCGSVKVIKKAGSATGPALQGAGFTMYKDVAPLGTARGDGDTATFADWACTTGVLGTCSMVNVPAGQYWLVETTTPAGYETVAEQLVVVAGTAQVEVGPLVDLPASRTTTLTTSQRFVPNDSATIEVAGDQGALAGSMRFRLYDNAACTEGTHLYDSGDIDIATGTANNTAGTPGTFRRTVSSDNSTAYSTTKSFYWLVTYTSTNPLHSNQDGECGKERSSITVDNSYTAP